jgi:hypothetical protein
VEQTQSLTRTRDMPSLPPPATRSHAKQHFTCPESEAANQLAASTPLSSSSKTSNRSASWSEPERRRRVSASDDIRAPAPARRPSAPYASSGSRFYAEVIKRMQKERMQQNRRMDTSPPTSEPESCRSQVHMMITRTLTAEMQASFEELGFSCSSPR